MSYDQKYAQTQPFTLAGAGANIGDATLVLTSFKSIDGVALTMTDFGTIGYGTLEPGNGIQEEQVSFSGVTQNGNGTATLTGIKTVLMLNPHTQTANLAKTHAGGTTFVISNTSGFYQTIIDYIDGIAIAGSPDASAGQKGISYLSVDPAIATSPIAVGTNDTRIPTADQAAALAGTGTPSVSNKFVTADTDALKQTIANLDTTTTLGTSNTKYPSQLAVKTYVDTMAYLTFKNGTATRDMAAENASVDYAHGLGRTPKKVKITGYLLGSGVGAVVSNGVYNGTTTSGVHVYLSDANVATPIADTNMLYFRTGGPRVVSASIAVDATNITLTWTKSGSELTGTAYLVWEVE